MGKIESLKIYNARMNLGIDDKLFFMQYIDFEELDVIVDFGSGEGSIGRVLSSLSILDAYNVKYIGYDNNPDMLSVKNLPDNVVLTDSLEYVKSEIKGKNSLLILSSVLHEVYSYSTDKEVKEFWNTIFSLGFKYISIRDMAYDPKKIKDKHTYKWAKKNSSIIEKNLKSDSQLDWWRLKTKTEYDFYNLLLKYRYVENWEREKDEKYLNDINIFYNQIVNSNYNFIVKEEFILPYLKMIVKQDFNYDIKKNTHIKWILKLKNHKII